MISTAARNLFRSNRRHALESVVVKTNSMSYLKAQKKRFFKNVTIQQHEGGYYLIQLDGKTIKTPLRHSLCVPGEMLAVAVANEWHMQSNEINTAIMPLTTICNTTIDNPTDLPKSNLIHEMIKFLHTDTVCSIVDSPESLVEFQTENWSPIRDWFANKFDVQVKASADLFDVEQPDGTIECLEKYLSRMNRWQLNGLQSSIDAIKSFILPIAVLHDRITTDEAVFLSRLELEYQMKRWGKFEGAHDVEMFNQQTVVAAGTLIYKLCSHLNDT